MYIRKFIVHEVSSSAVTETIPKEFMKTLSLISLFVCAALCARAAELVWQTDLTKAQAKARAENKMVLINFTGDFGWCSECKNFEAEVLKDDAFQQYARTNFVLVEMKVANKTLEEKYDIHAWPTLVLLNAKGDTLHIKISFRKDEDAKAVVDEIESHRK